MRNRIRLYLHLTYGKRKVRVDFGDGEFGKRRILRAQRAVRQPYRDVEFARQPGNAGDMVSMLVRDHDTVQLFGLQSKPSQPRHRFCKGETAVKQDPGLTDLHNEGVPLAAATEKGEPHLRWEGEARRRDCFYPDSETGP